MSGVPGLGGINRLILKIQIEDEVAKQTAKLKPNRLLTSKEVAPLAAIADRERGAMKRLDKIIKARNGRKATELAWVNGKPTNLVSSYIQGDPRGAVLYILRPGDVPDGKDVNGYYSRGICVY